MIEAAVASESSIHRIRELTGNFVRPFAAILTPRRRANSIACGQGIFWSETGKFNRVISENRDFERRYRPAQSPQATPKLFIARASCPKFV
jgi:hypothetical protein